MEKMQLFVDTHDKTKGSFPEGLTAEQFKGFFAKYEAACMAEGVVLLKVNVGLEDGRAFCMNLAPNAEAVRRAHERVGLPYDSITAVQTVTPTALL